MTVKVLSVGFGLMHKHMDITQTVSSQLVPVPGGIL